MPERSTTSQTVAIGTEATPGTAVAATRRLGSIGFQMGVQTETQNRRPTGQKYDSLVTLGQEWTEADIEGAPVYPELPYIFSSLINAATVTQIMDATTATGAFRWVFESNSFGEDAPKTFTIEQGSSFRAHRVSNGIITDFTLEFDREELSIEGTMLAKAIEDGITLTPGATMRDQVPVLPKDVSVFLDATAAELGTTKLNRALSGSIDIESRYAPLWVVDASQPSFVTTLESNEAELSFSILQMADAQAMANLTAMRGGQTRFLRFQAQGPTIYSGTTPIRHSFVIEMAGQVQEVEQFDDEDGVYAIGWTFGVVHDPTWNKAYRVEVVTNHGQL